VLVELTPGDPHFVTMIATLFGAANAGHTNDKGQPGLLQSVLIGEEFWDVIRFMARPFWKQRTPSPCSAGSRRCAGCAGCAGGTRSTRIGTAGSSPTPRRSPPLHRPAAAERSLTERQPYARSRTRPPARRVPSPSRAAGRRTSSRSPGSASGAPPGGFQDHPYQPALLDRWTPRSHVAAAPDRIGLAPDVLPLRPPAVSPRAAATLDLLSDARLALASARAAVEVASSP
jgi:hypothetical protein